MTLSKAEKITLSVVLLVIAGTVAGILIWHFTNAKSNSNNGTVSPTYTPAPPDQPFAMWVPQRQLRKSIAPCPGPFQNAPSYAVEGSGTIDASNEFYGSTEWANRARNCVSGSSTGAIFYPPLPPYSQAGTINLFGPNWDDYRQQYPNYDCGPKFTANDQYTTGGNWSVGESTQLEEHCTKADAHGLCFGDGMENLEGGCCCPANDAQCNVQPRFNWILSVCQGRTCNGDWHNNSSALQAIKSYGSQVVVNYIAAYNFDSADNRWKIVADSSFNTDGSRPAYDTMQAHGGMTEAEAWLNPVPGGAVQWGTGFSPVGAEGLGPLASTASTPNLRGESKGMMWVLSTEKCFNMAFFMLNQTNLDRGGGGPTCDNLVNCWGASNSGEIDFLESPFSANDSVNIDYRRLYMNSFNQVGRSFPEQVIGSDRKQGDPVNANANGGWGSQWETSCFHTSSDPADTNPDPFLYVCIVDSVGSWVYKIPSDQANSIWPGLSRKTAVAELDAAPVSPPVQHQPNYDPSLYSLTFVPMCQATKWGGPVTFDNPTGAYNQGCGVNAQQGFCQNWFQLFADTTQWRWTETDQWSRTPNDKAYISHGGPARSDGQPLCPEGRLDPLCDGVSSTNCDLTRKWCQPMPWNRYMEPFACANPYTANCAPKI